MKIPHLRWVIAALLFTSTVINYIDRQTLSIVAPLLTAELGLTPVQYANIVTAFLAAYTVMYIGSGLIVDRFGTRWSLAAFMAWWSVANMLHGAARSAMQFGVLRFLLGAGESGNFMAAVKVVSEWYPAKERAFVNGLANAGAAVGAVVATPLVTFLAVRYGWRTAFVVTGAIGLFWLAAWLLLFYLPDRHPYLTPAERALIEPAESNESAPVGDAKDPRRIRWLELLTFRETWGLLLSRFFSDPVWWFYLFWLPKYLVEQRGFTMVEMGMLAWLPYLTADAGSIVGGLLSGYLIRKKWPVLDARAMGMLPFALIMPVSIAIPYTPRSISLILISVVTFAHMAWKTNLVTITNDIYPRTVVASVAGIVAFGNGVGGTLFTWLTGRIVTEFSYGTVFVIMGCMHPLAYILFRWLVKGEVRKIAEAPGERRELVR